MIKWIVPLLAVGTLCFTLGRMHGVKEGICAQARVGQAAGVISYKDTERVCE